VSRQDNVMRGGECSVLSLTIGLNRIEGRLPDSATDCVVDMKKSYQLGLGAEGL
jgi:hypothetical protein